MKTDVIYIGHDPGHSSTRFAQVKGGEIITETLPSTIGMANRSRKDGLSLVGVIRPQHTLRQPLHVVSNDVEYLVGPNVDQFTKPIDRMDFNRFTDSPELRAVFYAGASRLLNGGAHKLALAMALPVAVLENKEEAVRIEQGIRAWMMGEHTFQVDGVETVLTITNIRARIPQPVATWFEWGMDSTGRWVKGKEAQFAPTLIIDEGFNTLDVLVVENGRISYRFGGGDMLGMSRAAEELIETVKHRHSVTLELCRANELIKAAVNGQKASIYVHGERTDITQITKSCVNSLAADVDNYLIRSLGHVKDTHHVLLTGGGVIALAKRLLQRFPKAVMMHEPALANVRGLAKVAIRPGILDA